MRAYTYIDHALASVGNDWIERRWSVIDGRTNRLLLKPASYDWIDGRCPELRVAMEGTEFGLEHMPQVEWFEENSPRGATLVVKRAGKTIQLVTRTFVYHELPCMVRAQSIMNLTEESLRIDSMIQDSLALDAAGLRFRVDDFRNWPDSAEFDTSDRAVALVRGEMGLFFGRESGGYYQLFAPEGLQCAVGTRDPIELDPHAVRHLPRTYLSFFIGPIREAMNRSFADMLADLRKHDDRLPEPA